MVNKNEACCQFHDSCADLYSRFMKLWVESEYDITVLAFVMDEISTTLLACTTLNKKELIKHYATLLNTVMEKRLNAERESIQ